MLDPLGFELSHAANGREGIDSVWTQQPDLILMDTVMPEMGGLETIHHLRQMADFEQLPIIAVSASTSAQDREQSLKIGANVFLAKPIDMERLLAQIATLLVLDLIREKTRETAPPAVESNRPLKSPPADEMALLHHLALRGNMRDIIRHASVLGEKDECYRPFTDRLRQLATEYQSRAILNLVEHYLGGNRRNDNR